MMSLIHPAKNLDFLIFTSQFCPNCLLGLTFVSYLPNKFSSIYIVLWLGLCYLPN